MVQNEKLLVSTSSFLKWFTKKTSAWVTVFRPAVFFTPRALRNCFCTQNSNVKLRLKPTSAATVLRRDACRNSVNVLSPCFIHYRSVKHFLFQTSQVFHHSHVHWVFFWKRVHPPTVIQNKPPLGRTGHFWDPCLGMADSNQSPQKQTKQEKKTINMWRKIYSGTTKSSWLWYQTPKIQILKTCF